MARPASGTQAHPGRAALRGRGALVLALLLGAGVARAELRSGRLVTVPPGEVVEGDLYALGGTVEVAGAVRGDLVALAGTVRVTGRVEGDVLAAGGTVLLEGPTLGSARLGGGRVALRAPVGEDVLAGGGQVALEPGGQVAGDVMVAGGQVQLFSPVRGGVHAAAGALVLGGRVAGAVDASVGQLELASGARLAGPLRYSAPRQAVVAAGAQPGEVQWTPRGWQRLRGPLPFLLRWARAVVGFSALGLLLALALPRFTRRTPRALRQAPLESLGLGLVVLAAAPVAAVLLGLVGAVLGGWWLGLVVLGLLGLAALAAPPLVGLTLGQQLLTHLGRRGGRLGTALVLGVALLALAWRLPWVGAGVLLLIVALGLGAEVRAALQLRPPPSPAR